jgi:hypothetical protein
MAKHASGPGASRAASTKETISKPENSTSRTHGKARQATLAYARLGWRVHPCHGITDDGRCSCGDPEHLLGEKAGKHPILNG